MKTETLKTILLIAFIIIAGILATCQYEKPAETQQISLQDTVFLSQWRREKAEKLKLVNAYDFKIQQLLQSRDSLTFCLSISDQLLRAYRFKIKLLTQKAN